MIRASDLERAVQRGIEFLAKSQLPSGEFKTLVASDPDISLNAKHDPCIFSTVNVATCLLEVPDRGVRPIINKAADFLQSEMLEGALWRFWVQAHPGSCGMPPDVDDTSCAAECLRRLNYKIPDNRRVLLANRNRKGLFRTWITPVPRHFFLRGGTVLLRYFWKTRRERRIFFTSGSEIPRTCTVESVVNANALLYLGDSPETAAAAAWIGEVVRKRRASMTDRYYQSEAALFYSVVRGIERKLKSLFPLAQPIVDALTALDVKNLSPLHLALCIRAQTSLCPDADQLRERISLLLSSQAPDGGWPAAAYYYDGYARSLCWGSRELTTGYCLESVAYYMATGNAL